MAIRLWCVALFACRPRGEIDVLDVDDRGTLEQSALISGRDGGYSVAAWEHSLWAYGDTVLTRPDEGGETWHTNSVSWTTDRDAGDGIEGFVEPADASGAPAYLLPYTADEVRFNEANRETNGDRWAVWPGALVVDPGQDHILVFYSKVLASPGAFNFETVGKGIAVWTGLDEMPTRPEFDVVDEYPTLLFRDEHRVGDAALVTPEGWLYAYGCRGVLTKRCRLGRVPVEQALDLDAWRFARNGEWIDDPRRAQPVFDAHDILTVHYHQGLERYLAVYSAPSSREVKLRTATTPEGPWSKAHTLFRAEHADDGAAPYSAVAHAEYDEVDAIYVTYFRGTTPFAGELRLIRIELTIR